MTSDRGRLQALTALIALQDVGGFSLPNDLLTAANLPTKVTETVVPQVQPYDIEQAADALLDDLAHNRTPDIEAHARRLVDISTAQARVDQAQLILRNAHEQAVAVAVNTAADLADRIITGHLQPALVDVLEQTSRHATALHAQPLDGRALLGAPAKVRTAWLAVQNLADRYTALRRARTLVNTVGLRVLEHDDANEFATFRDPHALTGYTPSTARPPQIDYPADPVDRMLWLVGPAAVGQPWLPTTNEQDAAWWNAYGDGVMQRQNAAVFAQQVGARGGFSVDAGSAA